MIKRSISLLMFLIAMHALPASATERQQTDLDRARAIFEELARTTPGDPDVYRYLAEIYAAAGDDKKSEAFFKEYAERRPGDYYPYYRLGDIEYSMDKKKEAKGYFRESLTRIDDDKADIQAKMAKARMTALLGDKKGSDLMYEELIRANEGDPAPVNSYISTLLDTKRVKDASDMAEENEARYGTDPEFERNLIRIKIARYRYDDAEKDLKALMQRYPDDRWLKTQYAYLERDMGDWEGAGPLIEDLLQQYPSMRGISDMNDEIFRLSRPAIMGGTEFRASGSERSYGPYLRYVHPVSSRITFDAGYAFDYDSANIPGYDPDFSTVTNVVDLFVRYRPHWTSRLSFGYANQLEGTSYVPEPILAFDYNHPLYGRLNVTGYYNRLFDDPTTALYFDGREDEIGFMYENTFYDLVICSLSYSSTWYRINGAKANMGMGDDFGRQDMVEPVLQFIVLKRPQIRVGYGFLYSKLHVVNNYLPIIPLIPEQEFSSLRVGITHDWNRWITTDLGGFIGGDPARGISFPDLYGFNIYNRLRPTKHVEIWGGYEYSSQTLANNVGRYQYFNVGVMYRF